MSMMDATDIAKSMAGRFEALLVDPFVHTIELSRQEATMALGLLVCLVEILEEDASSSQVVI